MLKWPEIHMHLIRRFNSSDVEPLVNPPRAEIGINRKVAVVAPLGVRSVETGVQHQQNELSAGFCDSPNLFERSFRVHNITYYVVTHNKIELLARVWYRLQACHSGPRRASLGQRSAAEEDFDTARHHNSVILPTPERE